MNPNYKIQSSNSQGSSAVLVTGGSGYVGAELVKQLALMDETVVSMYRHRLPEPRDNVFPVCSDLASEELLAAPLRGVETVIHLAWEKNLLGPEADKESWGFGKHDAKTKNIRLLKNLLSAMEKANTKRIIFVSAFGSSYHAKEPFLREKYFGEICVLNSKIPEKMIVRPGIIYGGDENRDKFIATIKRVMRFPGIYPVPRFSGEFYPLHIVDFVNGLISLVHRPLKEQNKIIDFVGKEGFSIEEILKLVAESDNRSNKIGIGSFVGDVLLRLFEKDLKKQQDPVRLKNYLVFKKADKNPLMLDESIKNLINRSRGFKEGLVKLEVKTPSQQSKLAPSS